MCDQAACLMRSWPRQGSGRREILRTARITQSVCQGRGMSGLLSRELLLLATVLLMLLRNSGYLSILVIEHCGYFVMDHSLVGFFDEINTKSTE